MIQILNHPTMDPLTISASVITIVQMTGTLVSYLNDVKNAPEDRKAYVIEASNLYALLVRLRFRIDDERNSDSSWWRQIQALAIDGGLLGQFQRDLELLTTKISSKHHLTDLSARMTWHSVKKDVAKTFSRIERLKSDLVIAMGVNIMWVSCCDKEF